MKVFDNINDIVRDDLEESIAKGSKVSIAAASFSMYAYEELKESLKDVDEFRFLFTSPAFTEDGPKRQSREFYIPQLDRENSLYGTEFEIKLRNELTQRAIARECAEWVKRKATFKANVSGENMAGFMTVDTDGEQTAYMPMERFTTVDIGCDRGNNSYNMVNRLDSPHASEYVRLFNNVWNDKNKLRDVTDMIISSMNAVYRENSPEFIYFVALYNIFSEFLNDISDDVLPNEATGFKSSRIWNILYDFQRDAALAIINKLEQYNGCILADSVGLGKTFTALAVIKYYENRNKSVLVLCPKRLADNWKMHRENYTNNPLADDRFNYDVLYHTDLSRKSGLSGDLDLSRINWGNYDLVVIDESHNFRNGAGPYARTRENRYTRLMDRIIRAGVQTKVLMLSATPVNNRFGDLKNQLAIAYEGNPDIINEKLSTTKPIDEIFRQAQTAFNMWSKLEPKHRTTDELLRRLDFDFFDLLDSVTIARSRRHVERYYNTESIGEFPKRLKPISLRPGMTDLPDAIDYDQIYGMITQLNLFVYTPSNYIFDSARSKYVDADNEKRNLTLRGRELGIRKLMSTNLLKRLESSVHSFRLTVTRILEQIQGTIRQIDEFETTGAHAQVDVADVMGGDLDIEDGNTDFTVGNKLKINLADMDYVSWRNDLSKDAHILEQLKLLIDEITPEHDMKLQMLIDILDEKIENPINDDNKKVLVFSAFSDTAEYLYEHIAQHIKKKHGLNTALVAGTHDGRTTIKGMKTDLNNVLTCFSPVSKGRDEHMLRNRHDIDILVATDCISEGQNLQDCDYLVNYDIHWNPVRIIQRFGRIDRIGSKNEAIQMVNFWPDMTLDEYIKLKTRVETRMKISVLSATGDENPLTPEEEGDLEYRRQQLEKLQEEVVDIEDVSGGISIMDLGLNEFRLDLLEYVKRHGNIDKAPKGLHAVVQRTNDNPTGVVFVLRNVNSTVNIDEQNRLHPFYMIYIGTDGEILCDHLHPKQLLDTLRQLCRGESEPLMALCAEFNEETEDGKNMTHISRLLSEAIDSIIDKKQESDLESLFSPGGTTALINTVSGLDDFELICFLAIR